MPLDLIALLIATGMLVFAAGLLIGERWAARKFRDKRNPWTRKIKGK